MSDTLTTSDQVLTRFQQQQRIELPTAVLGLSRASNDGQVYAACMDGVYEVNVVRNEVTRLYAHQQYASRVVWRVGHGDIISSGYDGQLIWYDLRRRAIYRRVHAHGFWSWDMALSADERRLVSVTGQYLAGAEDYSPLPEREPSVKVFDATTGDLLHAFPHVPSVQSVAISPDGTHVAAGNLMGEIRVWNLETGAQVNVWRTEDFTSWGIIKSHCYLGGIFALSFDRDGESLYAAGMGPMRDPMAGNGRQLWQRFAWRESPARKIDELHAGGGGEGLMEALAFHPHEPQFLMGGRLRGGEWNTALFDVRTGARHHHFATGYRLSSAQFSDDGQLLVLAGTKRQPSRENGQFAPFGIVERFAPMTG